MISQNQIVRLLDGKEYRHLVERILSNGRCRSSAARSALTRQTTAEPAALGLGLQRLLELTYRPSPTADRICARLMHMQQPDGLFADSETRHESLLAASAVALGAVVLWIEFQRHAGRAGAGG